MRIGTPYEAPKEPEKKPIDQSEGGNWLTDFSDVIHRMGKERHEQEILRIEAFAHAMPQHIKRIQESNHLDLLILFESWAGRYESHWRERKLMDKLRRVAREEILKRMRS